MTSEHTIRPGRDDDVWRDEDGTTWVRQQQLIDSVKFNLNRLRAAADQLEAVQAWLEGQDSAEWESVDLDALDAILTADTAPQEAYSD